MDLSFVIVEPDPVVRMDLVGTLEHSFPAGTVVSVSSASEIGQLFETLTPSATLSAVVFVNGALMPDLAPEIVRAIVGAGGRIVSIGRSDSDAIPSTMLDVPFTMSMILDVLAGDAPGPRGLLPEVRT